MFGIAVGRSRAPTSSPGRWRWPAPSCTSTPAATGAERRRRDRSSGSRPARSRGCGRTSGRASPRTERWSRRRRRRARARARAARSLSLLRHARPGSGSPLIAASSSSTAASSCEPVGIEPRRLRPLEVAELLAVGVAVVHRQARLRGAQRHLLALERDARADERVLERVLLVRELGGDDPALARLPQPVEALAVFALRGVLRLVQRLELRAREQVGVAGDDRRLLRHLLLADANGAAFLGALEVVVAQARLVLGWGANGCGRHGSEQTSRAARFFTVERSVVDRVRLAQIGVREAVHIRADLRRAGDECNRDGRLRS